MKVKRLLAVGLVMAGFVPLACGSDGDGGEEEEEEGPDFSEVPALVATAYCDGLAKCMPPEIIAEFLGTPNCDAFLEKQLGNGFFEAVEVGLEEGTIEYHAGRLEECRIAIRDGGCTSNRYIPECEAALSGTVASDGDCVQDAECIGERFCKVEALCPGACAPKLEDGDDCTRDAECAEGSVCFEAVCTPELGEGDECEECGVGCGGGRFCLGASEDEDTTGTCRSLNDVLVAAEGEACDIHGDLCEPGAHCAVSNDGGVASWTCEAQAPSGGTCNVSFPDMCPSGEYCSGVNPAVGVVQGICTQLPTDGNDCVPGSCGRGRCAAEHVCVEGTCRKLKQNDASCEAPVECFSGNCEAGTCVPDTPCAI